MAVIHDRMPVILAQDDYARWLGDEPDPRDLMRPFPAGPDAHVADFDAGQRVRERRSFNHRADRTGNERWVGKRVAARSRDTRLAFCPVSLLRFPWGGLARCHMP